MGCWILIYRWCSATTNIASIPALPANAFCAGANLSFTYTVTDACGSQSCTSTFVVAPATPIVPACATAVSLPACSTDAAVQAAYTAWAAGFSFTGGCSATTNITSIPALPANAFCAGANLSFTYTVTDACGSQSCTSTFVVAPATPIVPACAAALASRLALQTLLSRLLTLHGLLDSHLPVVARLLLT